MLKFYVCCGVVQQAPELAAALLSSTVALVAQVELFSFVVALTLNTSLVHSPGLQSDLRLQEAFRTAGVFVDRVFCFVGVCVCMALKSCGGASIMHASCLDEP